MEPVSAMTVLGEVFTQITTWMGSIAATVTSSPLYLLPVGIFAVGAVLGLVKRLIGR